MSHLFLKSPSLFFLYQKTLQRVMSGRMVEEGTPKSRPSIKAMKKLAKAVTINFFRTLENAQRLAATQGALRQKRMALSQ